MQEPMHATLAQHDRLSLADIAALYGLSTSTVRTYNGQAAIARRNGTAKAHDFPAPIDRVGNSPVFDALAVRDWFDHRPGRGAGGGRPPKTPAKDRPTPTPRKRRRKSSGAPPPSDDETLARRVKRPSKETR